MGAETRSALGDLNFWSTQTYGNAETSHATILHH